MTALDNTIETIRSAGTSASRSAGVFLRDVGHGMLEVSHNTLALLGLLLVGASIFVFGRAELRHTVETEALSWLQSRHEARQPPAEQLAAALAEPEAISRATAADPKALSRPQAAVTHWISRRYKVAPEPIGRLVQEAWQVGERAGIEPTLILAIMAVESSFNPFAQSSMGAQGLMQVMTKVHDDKYEAFGGNHAAFDPVTNLRVGVQVLKECISRAGSLEGGLRYYVGAANLSDDGGYATKVLFEQSQLRQVAQGKSVVPNVAMAAPVNGGAPTPAPTLKTRAEGETLVAERGATL